MTENSFEAIYHIKKKSKLLKFYESNKILIFSFILSLIVAYFSINFYLDNKENKRILLSDNYIKAKFYLEKGNKTDALNILKEIFYSNDSTYSTLSFFLILDGNLITDDKQISNFYDHLLQNNKFDDEIRNLLIYKKALFDSNFVSEAELLKTTKPLLNNETLWKPHALILLGDYFVSKGENTKAIEFYQQIFTIKGLNHILYD